jgi:hypothetical protein
MPLTELAAMHESGCYFFYNAPNAVPVRAVRDSVAGLMNIGIKFETGGDVANHTYDYITVANTLTYNVVSYMAGFSVELAYSLSFDGWWGACIKLGTFMRTLEKF